MVLKPVPAAVAVAAAVFHIQSQWICEHEALNLTYHKYCTSKASFVLITKDKIRIRGWDTIIKAIWRKLVCLCLCYSFYLSMTESMLNVPELCFVFLFFHGIFFLIHQQYYSFLSLWLPQLISMRPATRLGLHKLRKLLSVARGKSKINGHQDRWVLQSSKGSVGLSRQSGFICFTSNISQACSNLKMGCTPMKMLFRLNCLHAPFLPCD